jgi:hypothetical protein
MKPKKRLKQVEVLRRKKNQKIKDIKTKHQKHSY